MTCCNYISSNFGGEKLVLFYTPFYGNSPWGNFSTCPHKCRISTDKNDLHSSHAVFFDLLSAELSPPWRDSSLEEQIWVFGIIESPGVFTTKDIKMDKYDGLFNWSMTYRRDSDLPLVAGSFIPLEPNSGERMGLFVKNSTKNYENS